jgi:hypothetical protein
LLTRLPVGANFFAQRAAGRRARHCRVHSRPAASCAAVTAIISETNNVSKAVADKVLKLYFEPERGVLPREGEIDLSALAQVIAMMAEAGALKPPLPAAPFR